ncbi:MAG: twin-arginine translocase TatA/TatE family subunit [Crocinitomicaceae bacterium]|nr:twin-arginine translocase TatA/TatE family subunit [Crocinitomicaceae bacterium]
MIHIPLFLNDISGSEILVIMLFILMFFGSKSIPSIAKTIGKGLYQIRNATAEIQHEIKNSVSDITTDINIKNILTEKQEELLAPMDQIYSEIENTMHYDNNTGNKEPIQTVEETAATTETAELVENKENIITNSNEDNSKNNDSSSDNNG